MSKRLTTSEFVAQAIAVHGDRYDYSRVEYQGAWHKVLIICKKHGEFLQPPVIHKMGVGCPTCGIDSISEKSRGTLENFLIEAKRVHGDRYDYSKSIYMGTNTKIIITCGIHGDFTQTPKNHTSNAQNCPMCARLVQGPQVTREDFIGKCIATHGDKYDYSKLIYRGNKKNVTIGCSVHGWFEQNALGHMQGQGCPKCGVEQRTQGRTKGTQSFIGEARLIHGDRYDYSRVEYTKISKGVLKQGCSDWVRNSWVFYANTCYSFIKKMRMPKLFEVYR